MAKFGSPDRYPGLRASRLRDMVDIQERIDDVDAAGAIATPTWRSIGRERANVTQFQGFRVIEIESLHSKQEMMVATYTVTIRYRTDVTIKHRLVRIGPPDMPMNILSVADPDSRHRRLSIIAQAGLVDDLGTVVP